MTFLFIMVLILFAILMRHPAQVAHFLNNLFNLPHPGPNDPQGACSCREHEGKNKYSFVDYLRQL